MSYMMELEINSQNVIIAELIKKHVVNYCVLMDIPSVIKKVSIIASGSSYNASYLGKYFFETISDIPSSVDYASEAANSELKNYDPDTLYIFLSQSGESVDTVSALKKIKEKGLKTLCITNNIESTMYKLADYKFDINAGREKAIAATKTFSATVLMLWLIALKAAQNKHIDISKETTNIYQLPSTILSALKELEGLDYAAKLISKQKEFSIAGFQKNYALAKEAALKIKETSYINTSAYPLGEFVHGHFALLNKSKVFLTFMTKDVTEIEKNLLKKIKDTYHPKMIVIGDDYEDYGADILIKIPESKSRISAIMSSIIALQLLALKVAIKLKRDVDKPQGLNKVVEK